MRYFVFFIVIASLIYADKGYSHAQNKHPSKENLSPKVAEQINKTYKKNIKDIFRKKCFDCHSNRPHFPWYYHLRIARSAIDKDIKEGKKHIDFTNDFPFEGHGSAIEDLKAISDSIRKNTMPPFRYKILHWKSGLTKAEKTKIKTWTLESLKLLKD